MGCTSSTEAVLNPHNGQVQTKKKLGGAYPGQRRPQHQPYVPPASAFTNGQATAHFVAYGGGNALTLVQQDGSTAPQTGKPEPTYIQVTLPDGVSSGQTIHVQAPDGRLNAIVVPPGFGPGSTFTVEFAEAAASEKPSTPAAPFTSSSSSSSNGASYPPPAVAAPAGQDDGFATGFNNPYWTPPPPPPTTTTTAVHAVNSPSTEPDIDYGSYPTSTAVPVYGTGTTKY